MPKGMFVSKEKSNYIIGKKVETYPKYFKKEKNNKFFFFVN